MRIKFLSFFAILVLSTPCFASEYFSWSVSVNGSQPTTLEYRVNGDKISGKIFGNEIEGYQVGRHIVFYRKSNARQIYHGWMSPNRKSIAGGFSHQGDNLGIWYGKRY